ncbi:1-acyl-sn-glycerol-3-phosphate acyltransferase [Bacillus tianshenii]|uniref:1-acyl-sn-glycerol-3-phosphate acyltransferase n=1 Tax=Sutcliffiella tianshenii TaxID=1463404 RepID=A0ABS2P1C6_9BACI|nr:lysophospholipid acyltransferase family protein [Bacillus tianshenii]MBM7620679.1 1-acyl-sn-glycerol-3-phosphate acyltransferase [Bacillus tianshenii]
MIPAKKSRAFDYFFDHFNKRFLKFHFRGVFFSKGADATIPASPCLFIVNHSTWWDALAVFHLNRHVIMQESFVMMHEKGIREYPFFRKIGAFSVNRENPKDIVLSLQYAKERLKENKTLWLFPQGDERHQEIRPLGFLPGALHIVKNTNIPIVPVLLYYSFGRERKPDIHIRVCGPVTADDLPGTSSKDKNVALEELFTTHLERLKQDVIMENTRDFKNLL